MRRRFNFTGRKRINHSDVDISLTEPEKGILKFYADLHLSNYSLPPASPVWVEAHDNNQVVRFDFGTVENPDTTEDTTLDTFEPGGQLLFRVKVTAPDERNKLLAIAKSIKPLGDDEEEGPTRSLLPVVCTDLGYQPWNLRFREGELPLLEINNKIEAGISLARNHTTFQSVVFPVIIRMILEQILFVDKFRLDENPDPEEEWMLQWIEYANRLFPGQPDVTLCDEDEQKQWIEDVVDTFCRKNHFLSRLKSKLEEDL